MRALSSLKDQALSENKRFFIRRLAAVAFLFGPNV